MTAEIGYAILFVSAFLLTVAFTCILLPVLRRKRAGQQILEIGPAWHAPKSGTPTMGGLAFVAAILAVAAGYAVFLRINGCVGELREPCLTLLYAALCGAIGFLDDRLKIKRHQNGGLSAPQKYFLQLLAAAVFLLLSRATGATDTKIFLPFTAKKLELGIFWYPLMLLLLTGIDNALNLTDGVDGLLASTVSVFTVFLFFLGTAGAPLLGVILLGAMLGFLLFNAHPAKIFMGDTGSLFLGGVAGAFGVLSARPVAVLVACGVFLSEAVSVILQVLWFRATGGKRLFLMAPLHHHFEKRGWSENKVVAVFSLAAAVFACLGLLLR